jgi:hypothetical protein
VRTGEHLVLLDAEVLRHTSEALVIRGVHLLGDRNLSLVTVHVLDATTDRAGRKRRYGGHHQISARITSVAASFVIFVPPLSPVSLHRSPLQPPLYISYLVFLSSIPSAK